MKNLLLPLSNLVQRLMKALCAAKHLPWTQSGKVRYQPELVAEQLEARVLYSAAPVEAPAEAAPAQEAPAALAAEAVAPSAVPPVFCLGENP